MAHAFRHVGACLFLATQEHLVAVYANYTRMHVDVNPVRPIEHWRLSEHPHFTGLVFRDWGV